MFRKILSPRLRLAWPRDAVFAEPHDIIIFSGQQPYRRSDFSFPCTWMTPWRRKVISARFWLMASMDYHWKRGCWLNRYWLIRQCVPLFPRWKKASVGVSRGFTEEKSLERNSAGGVYERCGVDYYVRRRETEVSHYFATNPVNVACSSSP